MNKTIGCKTSESKHVKEWYKIKYGHKTEFFNLCLKGDDGEDTRSEGKLFQSGTVLTEKEDKWDTEWIGG